jgi:uncharacterized membrane protein YdjX (TVP38/TMEM64 family)
MKFAQKPLGERVWKARIVLGIILGAIAWLFLTTPAFAQTLAQTLTQTVDKAQSFNLQTWLLSTLQWVESLGVWGGLAFMGIYIIATVAFLPASILTLAAGVVFGVFLGSCYVFLGATLGAIAAFLVGRYAARDWISQKIAGNKQFRAIDTAVAQAGFKIVLLTRLSPAFPFNLLNYAFGVTGVTLRDYALASIGMIPGTIMYVYIGSLSGDLAKIGTENQPTDVTIQWIIRIIGLVATIAVTVYITRLAQKALAESIDESNS